MPPLTGRLAPSPTGSQHLGNARTYLIAWLSARSREGRVALRIEDIDVWRNRPGAKDQLIEDLSWLGLDWDGEAMVQSEQREAHERALEELKRLELVYPCTCTRSDIQAASSAPHLEHEGPTYPGTCAHRTTADAATLTKPYSWRFRVADSPPFEDLYLGATHVDLRRAGGDFILWRSMVHPAYQLAVVVDDAAQCVTEVVRGDDLVASTPRQLLLYRALGLAPPRFAHVPLVAGEDGLRLAKRHGATKLADYRARGISAEAVIGLLAWSCGWLAKAEPITARELLPLFRWDTIPRERFVVTGSIPN